MLCLRTVGTIHLVLTVIYNRERAWLKSQNVGDDYVQCRQEACAHAFAELEMYIREKQLTTDGCCYFKLVELYDLYRQRLEQFDVDPSFVHRTRLKEQIWLAFQNLRHSRKDERSGLPIQEKWGKLLPKRVTTMMH